MYNQFYIAHDIPGRLRVIVDELNGRRDHNYIVDLFGSLKGIKNVRIEPIINSMLIEYDLKVTDRKRVLRYVSIFFKQTFLNPIDNLITGVKPTIRRDIFYSFLSGVLLLASIARKTSKTTPDVLDYIVMTATAFTVLSHGETDKLKHPDVIAGLISMLSLGPSKIHQVSAITWGVNLLEILLDMSKGRKFNSKKYIYK